MCRQCHTRQHAEWRDRRRNNAASSLDDWLKKIKALPYPYQTLTEEQWMEACRHFGCCAYCGEGNIDARSMFISFKDGGRYCAWNIIPACEKCETALKATPNPFIRMDDRYNRDYAAAAKKYGFTVENLNKIVDYLQSKMEVNE